MTLTTIAVRLLARHSDQRHDDAVILVRRAPGDSLAGYWELPGGKVDREEQDQPDMLMLALRREVREETTLRLVGPGIHRATTRFSSATKRLVEAHLIECVAIGTVSLSAEHDDYLFWQTGQALPTPMTETTVQALSQLG